MSKKTALVVQEEDNVPAVRASSSKIRVVSDAATLAELEGAEGAGYSTNMEDRGVPLLYIAQKGSPQIDKKKSEKYIAGLEFGDIFNNLSKEFYKGEAEGVQLLPCYFRANWNRWTPRDSGGGFGGSEPRDTPLLKTAKVHIDEKSGKVRRDIYDLPDGDQLVLTHHYYCIVKDTWEPVVVPMSSSQLGPSRTLQILIGTKKIEVEGRGLIIQPSFWTLFNFKTVYRDDGDNQWYVWNPEIAEENTDPQLRAYCKAFYRSCLANEVKTSNPDLDTTVVTGEIPI